MFAVSAWCVVYAIEHAGNSPTHREIAEHFGVHRSAIGEVLNRMMKYGIACRNDNKLMIVGGQYVPPPWYIEQIPPPLATTDQSETAWRNQSPIHALSNGRH